MQESEIDVERVCSSFLRRDEKPPKKMTKHLAALKKLRASVMDRLTKASKESTVACKMIADFD